MIISNADLLLQDRLAPITTNMGFIEIDYPFLVNQFVAWVQQREERTERYVEQRLIDGSLDEVLLSLTPLTIAYNNRFLLIPTNSQWVAYLDNGHRGTDPSAISHLAKRCQCRSIYIVERPHTIRFEEGKRKGRQGALIFKVYGPEKMEWLNLLRSIRLENDVGKWTFEQLGDPFPFEDVERYSARRKTDRFTFDMMKHYLEELGLRPFDEAYYLPSNKPNATLVEICGKLPGVSREISFEEARELNYIE